MGKKVDHWFELYGKAVEDNTLQDRIEAHRLQQQQQQQELHQQQQQLQLQQQQQQQQSWFKTQQEGKKKFSYVQQLLQEEEEQERREQASNWKPSTTTATTTTAKNNMPQIPLNVLKDIVRNVLLSQGISNPSEQLLEESIQKYLQNQTQQVIRTNI